MCKCPSGTLPYHDTEKFQVLVLEYQVLEERMIKGGECGQGLDELQGILPLNTNSSSLKNRINSKVFGHWKKKRKQLPEEFEFYPTKTEQEELLK